MSAHDEVIYDATDEAGEGGAREPTVGDATVALGEYLVREGELPNQQTFDNIVASSVRIVAQCKPFGSSDGRRTGLVVGYVQSGKTMSMTTVASLARDNGCRLVILLAGISKPLLVQTARDRLRPYLRGLPDERRSWRLRDTVESADLSKTLRGQLASWVAEWKRASVPEERKRPLIITVMKNHTHLGHLRDLLSSVDLHGVPSLVIDDEADQAGLDTTASKRAKGKEAEPSTTYARISEIRDALPNHTYLQYTATPQAPLLISLADMLSPDFAEVLQPGDGYTGGRAFFRSDTPLVQNIDEEDLFKSKEAPLEPPDSLKRAMREFYVGASVAVLRNDSGPRSMLVHPSQSTDDHEVFWEFVQRISKRWLEELRLPDGEADREECIERFRVAYEELARTDDQLPELDRVVEELPYVLADSPVWKVNSDDGHEVDWSDAYAHILVGGDKLNRGYTVKGLTVTYMPRNPGGWNADTVQQRARFLGYKKSYLGLCRVHLHPDVRAAYSDYVLHEEDIRQQLIEHRGRPLKEWKRAFLLGQRLKPTRGNVLSESLVRPKHKGWFQQSYAHTSAAIADSNRDRLRGFLQSLNLHPSSAHAAHGEARLPLQQIYTDLLVEWGCFGSDALEWTAMLLWLNELMALQADASCQLVVINADAARRRRSEDKGLAGRINQLFEGRRAKKTGDAYPGDRAIREKGAVTIQIHRLDISRYGEDAPTAVDVPALAIHLPDGFEPRGVVVQAKAER